MPQPEHNNRPQASTSQNNIVGVIHNSDNSQTHIYEGYELIEHPHDIDTRYQNPMLDTFHEVELGLLKTDTLRRTREIACPTTQPTKPPPPYPGTKPPIAEKPKKLSSFVPSTNNPSHILPTTSYASCVFDNHTPKHTPNTHYEYITDDIHNFLQNPIHNPIYQPCTTSNSVIFTQHTTQPVMQPPTQHHAPTIVQTPTHHITPTITQPPTQPPVSVQTRSIITTTPLIDHPPLRRPLPSIPTTVATDTANTLQTTFAPVINRTTDVEIVTDSSANWLPALEPISPPNNRPKQISTGKHKRTMSIITEPQSQPQPRQPSPKLPKQINIPGDPPPIEIYSEQKQIELIDILERPT